MRNGDIVVLLPGISGSVLTKDGSDVFGLTVSAGLRALWTGGGSIRDLALTEDPPGADDLGDGVVATALAPDAHLIPGLWRIDGYDRLERALLRHHALTREVDYFRFPYDWRRDNRVAARRLQVAAEVWLRDRRKTFPEARLILVAHSMGGLVARYFLEVLGGWRDARWLVTFGTPFRGSLNALNFLGNGFRKLGGLVDLSATLRSFTSIYQLLPIYPCLRLPDGPLRRLTEVADVPGLSPDKVRDAREFHGEIERAVARNLDDAAYRDLGYRAQRIMGIEHATFQSGTVIGDRIRMNQTFEQEPLYGDGTVPRVSATPPEVPEEHGTIYACTRHASLQNAEAVIVHLRGVLTAEPLGRFLAGNPVTVAVDLDDVYEAGEPVIVKVKPSDPGIDLTVSLERLAGPAGSGGENRIEVSVEEVEDWQEVTLPSPGPGCYRVLVRGDDEVEPVSDLVVVGSAGV